MSHEGIAKLEELDRDQCLELLGYHSFVGRLSFVVDGRPTILPVNYLLDQDSIVLRTARGTTISGLDGAEVAFEVDDNRPLAHGAWSVLVQGTIKEVIDPDALASLRHTALMSWAWREADTWLRISITSISGRRLPAG